MSDQPREQFLYFFGGGRADGSNELRPLIGGKGASLAEMTRAGLNVPPGFTISAECCRRYFERDGQWPDGLRDELRRGMSWLEQQAGRSFGRGDNPLLVAVRSGAAESMPGMMETILNVGLNPECVQAMSRRTGDPRAAWREYRDFLVTAGENFGAVSAQVFAEIVHGMLAEYSLDSESQLTAQQFEELCQRFRITYQRHSGRDLPDDPMETLFQAVEAVFRSWQSERAVAYRKHHHIEGFLGTAVNIQMMCPSEVSGVLFTAHPVDPALDQMVLESWYGLGESVVLGKVTPDRFVIDRTNGAIVERQIQEQRSQASLTDAQVQELVALGRRVETYFGHPCDIEWGLAGGQIYLLQARAIKRRQAAATTAELEPFRQAEIARLKGMAAAGGTVWSRYNLYEILPEPTPMTWSIVQKLMAGRGGFGLMYRDLGFDPDPALDEIGAFDLVCGRPYCNLSREPRLYYRQLPFEHPIADLKKDPSKALYPQAKFTPARASWKFWLLLPVIFVKLLRANGKLAHITNTFADDFRDRIVPPFLEETRREAQVDLTQLKPEALLDRLNYWIQRTLRDFARDSLKPTALADNVQNQLLVLLTRLEGAAQPIGTRDAKAAAIAAGEKAQARLRQLVMGVRPDPDADLPTAVRDLATGRLDKKTFLEKFGHRGHHEMELAHPRWAEAPEELEQLVRGQKGGSAEAAAPLETPAPFAESNLPAALRTTLEQLLKRLHTFLALRETGKHHLMRGYALIRRILVELDRRFGLHGGIFFLTLEELPELVQGEDLSDRIAQRRKEREMLLALSVPPVLFSDDLDAIGRSVAPAEGQASYQGIPLSAGIVEGPALVLDELPELVPDGEPYVLVCPSTDPAWMPLFVRARALVMETGGMLSHGAIVAREFGLPAVAGLPDIHKLVRTGQRLQVDGGSGRVNVLD